MNKEDFVNLRKKAKEDIDFNDENYHIKTMNMPKILQFYTDLSLKEKASSYKLEEERCKLYKKLYNHYKLEDAVEWSTKDEVKIQVEGDDEYIKVMRKIEWQKIIISFIDNCINNIKTMGYSLKQYHDIKLLKNGILR